MKRLDSALCLVVIIMMVAAATACTGEPSAEKDATLPETSSAETGTSSPAETTPAPQSNAPGTEETPATRAPATAPPPAPKPAPASAPTPTPVTYTLPAGASLTASFVDSVSSAVSQVGDPVRARVVEDLVQDGVAIIPAGSMVVGAVTEAVPLTKKIGGRAKLTVAFTSIELTTGGTATIRAAVAEKGKSETKKDAATIGGAAAGGAILGTVIKDDDKEKGALIGAVVGAAAGTAVAMKTQGKEVEMPAGTMITVVLELPAEVTLQR